MDKKMKYPEDVVKLVDECKERYTQAHWIDLSEFMERRESESWAIVDARSEVEIAVSTIPEAISMDEFCANLESYRQSAILIYCTIGCRSGDAAESLMADGFQTHNLWGGVIAWALHGNQFTTSDGKDTYRVHVFDEKWNVIPPPYVSIW